MSSDVALATVERPAALGLFGRYLTGWVVVCIIAGIVLGQLAPELFRMLVIREFWRRDYN
jgi:ACR3 family arsenite transporter